MNTRRIIFVNRFFYPDQSATSRILSDLAFALAHDGAKVAVIASRSLYDDSASDLAACETVDGVEIHRVCRPRFSRQSLWGRAVDSLVMYQSFARAALRLGEPGDVLVAKTDPPMLGMALTPIARAKRLKMVNWLQDLYPEIALALGFSALAPAAPLLAAARNASLRNAACNAVICEHMRGRVESAGVDPARIVVVPNWCDEETIVPVPREVNALRKTWGLDDKFVVGYSGNLGRAHEYLTLLEAASRLRNHTEIVFLFIGGGYLHQHLKREIEGRSLGATFKFLPYQPDAILAQSLSVPDIHWLSQPPAMEGLILPSKFYGIAAAGRPIVVVGDVAGELSELVLRADCGAAVTAGDGEGLARLILALKDDPDKTTRMGQNARHMLDESFRRKQSIAKWQTLLRSL